VTTSREVRRLSLAIGAMLVATVLTWLVREFAENTLYAFFVAAAALATWSNGWRVGALAVGLSALVIDLLFLEPVGRLSPPTPVAAIRLLSFALAAAFVIGVTEALCRARSNAERMAAEAEAARKEAERANAAKSTFVSTMSHEIRTPITAILGFGDLLDEEIAGPLAPRQREYVTRIQLAGRHLLGLVNDALDLAKVDAGRLRIEQSRELLSSSVEVAVSLIQPQANQKHIALDVEECPHTLEFEADGERVRQILVNLLANAVKFTPTGGAVTVRCSEVRGGPVGRREGVAVRVRDTGPGIAPADQERVFEPFEQAESGPARPHEGTGLGLAISRRLARLMGGDLVVASDVGQGACFTLTLPAPTSPGSTVAALMVGGTRHVRG
jgi:signal transduction histidine kinase